MPNPKRPSPENLATQIASHVPGVRSQPVEAQNAPTPQGPSDRRTAALPQAPVPIAAPTDRTMTFDPSMLQPRGRVPLPTMMSMPQAEPEPFRLSEGTKRWVGGPLLALLVGLLTVWISAALTPPPPPKVFGRLRLSSDPEGATVLVNGTLQPHATPTVIEGEVGTTLKVSFRLDGYNDRDTEVLVSEGERPFRTRLDLHDGPVVEPDPEPEPDVTPPPTLEPPHAAKDVGHAKKVAPKEAHYARAETPTPTGTGTISVHVRPWAIVFVDGNKVRQTPVDHYSLSAGLHSVELVNDGLKKREKVTVEVRNGGSEEVRRDWGK